MSSDTRAARSQELVKQIYEAGAAIAGGPMDDRVMFAFGAEFVEVRVDARTCEVRLPEDHRRFRRRPHRLPRMARSEYLGSLIWGIGSALHEATELGEHHARYVNDNVAEYLIPGVGTRELPYRIETSYSRAEYRCRPYHRARSCRRRASRRCCLALPTAARNATPAQADICNNLNERSRFLAVTTYAIRIVSGVVSMTPARPSLREFGEAFGKRPERLEIIGLMYG